MTTKMVQDILPLVEKPSRYLGTETNTIKKNQSMVDLNICLAFPDLYEIGTSHFGLQILYHILNNHPLIAAERVFAPATDMESHLRKTKQSLFSLEAKIPLKKMDIIGFSLLYELNYTNILTILDLSGIPFFANERDDSFPFIIAGGPCMCNPEPVADFFDAIVIGDGETVIIKMAEAWLSWKKSCKKNKNELLKVWSEIEGVYIPSFFQASFDQNGLQTLLPIFPEKKGVIKRIVEPELENIPFPDKPVIPYGRPIHDRLRLEVARGCTRGCRFCQAGMIYRPVRERSLEKLISIAEKAIPQTGYEDVSLLSLSTGDYGCLSLLMQELMARYANQHVAISLPSVRAGTLTPELMNLIKEVRKTGFTIAPEAGTQRLRDVINKNLTEDEIIETVSLAFDTGWQIMKLYFMTGLPTETDKDLQGIVDLVRTLRKGKIKKQRFRKINVSVTTFIPKPHVPFQWMGQISLAESKENIRRLKRDLKMPGVNFKWQIPEASLIEGLFARGDRRLSHLLVRAYQKGCRFDGWTDRFNFQVWQEAIGEIGIDTDFYTTRQRDINEPLPWSHIDSGVTHDFLVKEWNRAVQGQTTEDCRTNECNNCGVCDFQTIEPRVTKPSGRKNESLPVIQNQADSLALVYRVAYTKRDQAKYFGHLELVNIMLRAIRRAKIPVRYSEGFHPKPRISFDDPLPLGIESNQEIFIMMVNKCINASDFVNSLNESLPEGIKILDCSISSKKIHAEKKQKTFYEVALTNGSLDKNLLDSFLKADESILEQKNRKGKLKKIDLKYMVKKIDILDKNRMNIIIRNEPGKTIRPFDVLTKIFALSENQAKLASVVKVPEFK